MLLDRIYLYAYANDDPVNNVDPDGEWAWAASLFFVRAFILLI